MKKVWVWLQGKKTSIATISGAVLVYALNQGFVSPEQAQLISVILMALGISANGVNYVESKK
ncbi:MAG: hypothetical protein QG588_783 [Candidatus Poribacteria bacterium]|nr:hypothetical protein [Candidatus Poribacteria bacterium]